MDRRESHRIKRRIPCEFEYEGHAYNGIVVDLSAHGVFLQTDTAVEPGTELDLHLRGERFPELTVRGRVVRRRFTPAVLASMIRRGVGLRLVNPPPAYHQALGLTPAETDPEPAWGAVDDWEPELEDDPSRGPIAIDIQVEPEEAPVLTPIAVTPADPDPEGSAGRWSFEEADEDKPAALASEDGWEALPGDLAVAAPGWEPESLCRADALLIDEGELDDVHALLEALGADPLRHRTVDSCGFTGWERPPRLVVAAARSALRLSVGPNVQAQGIVTIAVVDTESQVLCGMLRRQGFRFVVRRPVHPEALRLLLMRALFRGQDRREAPRVPFGCQIALRFRVRRQPATLLELSRTGCRLLARDWLDPGDRVSLRIPRTVTGNRALTLTGRVLRSERRRAVPPAQRMALGLRFDRLSPEGRARLEALIAAHALGPTPLRRAARPRVGRERAPVRGGDARASEASSARATAAAELPERRHERRAWHRQEVLALEPGLQRVRHALLGVDLSHSGLRVEPHPELALGDRVELGIYDAACLATLVVEAEVVRDDGAQGLMLRFQDLTDSAACELARIVEHAPQIEASGRDGSRGVVVAEVLSARPV